MGQLPRQFGPQSTADDVLDGHDLSDRLIFITGGTSGLGREVARAMAARGAHIVLAARDQARLDQAASAIIDATGNGRIETIELDLANLENVRACAAQAATRFERIDILINNAGIMACPMMRTDDGFEMQFGTNHLGHFLLTKRLMPLIRQGRDRRIITLSSRGHHFAPVHLDDPNFEHREYDKWDGYNQSKTANILFTRGLEARFGPCGIHAIAVHPGAVSTDLGRHMTRQDQQQLEQWNAAERQAGAPGPKSPAQGAATICWAATAADLDGVGGIYCEDCQIAAIDDDAPHCGVRSYAMDMAIADQLWSISEALVGESFHP